MLYGKTDEVPGLFYVATEFANVNGVPLWPRKSYVVFDEDASGFRGVAIGLDSKSVLLTYSRMALTAAAIVCVGIVLFQRATGHRWGLPAVLFGALIAGLTGTFAPRLRKANYERACELAQRAGLPDHVRAGLRLRYGRVADAEEAEEIARRLGGEPARNTPAASATEAQQERRPWVVGHALAVLIAGALTLGGYYQFWAETGPYAWITLLELRLVGHVLTFITPVLAALVYGAFAFLILRFTYVRLSQRCDPFRSVTLAVGVASLIVFAAALWSLLVPAGQTLDPQSALEKAAWLPRRVAIEGSLWTMADTERALGVRHQGSGPGRSHDTPRNEIYVPLHPVPPHAGATSAYLKISEFRLQNFALRLNRAGQEELREPIRGAIASRPLPVIIRKALGGRVILPPARSVIIEEDDSLLNRLPALLGYLIVSAVLIGICISLVWEDRPKRPWWMPSPAQR